MIIIADIKRNRRNIKCAIFLISFRISSLIRSNKVLSIILFPLLVLHIMFFNWVLGFDIPLKTNIGEGIIIYHGQGLVINADTVIGENCILRHNTTIGNKMSSAGIDLGSPRVGNNCDIGAHVIILGPIVIGENVIIGAGTIVTKDVPSNSIVYGSPLVIKSRI